MTSWRMVAPAVLVLSACVKAAPQSPHPVLEVRLASRDRDAVAVSCTLRMPRNSLVTAEVVVTNASSQSIMTYADNALMFLVSDDDRYVLLHGATATLPPARFHRQPFPPPGGFTTIDAGQSSDLGGLTSAAAENSIGLPHGP